MAVRDDSIGRAAHTSYEIIERLYATTLMAAQIHTGRTHQVRVHFQFIGHPLVGDENLRRTAERPRQGTDQLRRAARDAACKKSVVHHRARKRK